MNSFRKTKATSLAAKHGVTRADIDFYLKHQGRFDLTFADQLRMEKVAAFEAETSIVHPGSQLVGA